LEFRSIRDPEFWSYPSGNANRSGR
jgi:hypothetical protein